MSTQLVLVEVLASRTIDDIEMGVLGDGSAYLTGRSLARLCGVAPSTIIERKDEWESGNRTGKFHRFLMSTGFSDARLAMPVAHSGNAFATQALAYPERVVMAFLEYFAFEVAKPEAVTNFRALGRAGLRLFVYGAVGYDPNKLVPNIWREFHDRITLHGLPRGYFSVFREMSELLIVAIQAGFRLDHHTVPDISVGAAWSKYWQAQAFDIEYGQRIRHEHNFPDYFPQARSNPQEMWVYPSASLGEYRRWLDEQYLPNQFPKYIAKKVKSGELPASTAQLVLSAVEAPKLLP